MHQHVQFFSDGIQLAADLFTPDNIPKDVKLPAIVCCHGFGGTKNFIVGDFAKFFVEHGFVALTFDYRGFGESQGPKWRLIPQEQCRDIGNAITYMQTLPIVDPEKIGIYGTSAGGGNVVWVAGTDDRVKATVAAVGYGDGERWLSSIRRYWEWSEFKQRLEADKIKRVMIGESEWVMPGEIMTRDPESLEHEKELLKRIPERAFKLPLESGEAIINFKPVTVVDRIAPRAIMFVGVKDDHLVPMEETLDLYARAKEPKKLVMMPPIGHHGVYYGDYITTILGAAVEFYRQNLT
jgi:dipeptidyl aminopeptidase/acylaminoacyl peptidase